VKSEDYGHCTAAAADVAEKKNIRRRKRRRKLNHGKKIDENECNKWTSRTTSSCL